MALNLTSWSASGDRFLVTEPSDGFTSRPARYDDLLCAERARDNHQPGVRNVELGPIVSPASSRVIFRPGLTGNLIDDIRPPNLTFHGVTSNEIPPHPSRIGLDRGEILSTRGVTGRNRVAPPVSAQP